MATIMMKRSQSTPVPVTNRRKSSSGTPLSSKGLRRNSGNNNNRLPSSSSSSEHHHHHHHPSSSSTTTPRSQNNNFISSKVSLHRTRSSLGSQYQTTPINKHYEINNQIYDAFLFHYDTLLNNNNNSSSSNNNSNNSNDSNNNNTNNNTNNANESLISGAFYLGIQFVETALLEIPKHGYYYSNENKKFVRLRKKNSKASLEVILILEKILIMMRSSSGNARRDNSSSSRNSLPHVASDEAIVSHHEQQQQQQFEDEIIDEIIVTVDEEDCGPQSVLLKNCADEWNQKLNILKELAKEIQPERLNDMDMTTYELKRMKVEKDWYCSPYNDDDDDDDSGDDSSSKSKYNHRGGNRSKNNNNNRRNSSKSKSKNKTNKNNNNNKDGILKSDFTDKTGGGGGGVDCNAAMGATLLSCSDFFCPSALSSSQSKLDTSTNNLPSNQNLSSSSPPDNNARHHRVSGSSSSSSRRRRPDIDHDDDYGSNINVRRSSTYQYQYHPPSYLTKAKATATATATATHGKPSRSSLIDDEDDSDDDEEDNIVVAAARNIPTSSSSRSTPILLKPPLPPPPQTQAAVPSLSSWNHSTLKKEATANTNANMTSTIAPSLLRKSSSGGSTVLPPDPPQTKTSQPKQQQQQQSNTKPPGMRKLLDPPSSKTARTALLSKADYYQEKIQTKTKKEVKDMKDKLTSISISTAIPVVTSVTTTNSNIKKSSASSAKKKNSNNVLNKFNKKTLTKNMREVASAIGISSNVGSSSKKKNRAKADDTQLEQALYLSELEAAKTMSMQQEEEDHWSGGGSCDESYVSGDYCDSNGSNNNNNNNNQAADYDLQRALYLSGLEVKTQNGGMSWEQDQQQQHQQYHIRHDYIPSPDRINEEEEEKRDDDLAATGPLSQPSSDYDINDRYGVVVKGTAVPVPSFNFNSSSTLDGEAIVGPPGATLKRRSSMFVSFDTLKLFCHEDFDSLRSSGRVTVSHVPTYQGRIPNSTNGCTVIAPLICIHHFHNNENGNENSATNTNNDGDDDTILSDAMIVKVIDEITPNILPQIRKNLGLTKHAFLIPHDAHESLIEKPYNLMCREQFLTVCGGSILEEQHLGVLIKELSTIRSKKLGATFFFHQHVIAILQIRRPSSSSSNNGGSDDTVWFDIIDSLPHRETLQRIKGDNTANSNGAISQLDNATEWMHNQWNGINEWVDDSIGGNGSTRNNSGKSSNINNSGIDNMNYNYDSSPSSPLSSSSPPISAEFESLGIQQQPNAARIRCFDAESLKATLQWYAFSAFTSENANYIDTWVWDEKLTDFDPRVFQAFLWKEA